jgi:hypothetical protein
MSIIGPTPEPNVPPAPQGAAITKDATSASMAVSANAPAGYSTDTKIKSLSDLREKAPEVWKKMLEGIATNIINEMKDAEERRRKILRDAGMT